MIYLLSFAAGRHHNLSNSGYDHAVALVFLGFEFADADVVGADRGCVATAWKLGGLGLDDLTQ